MREADETHFHKGRLQWPMMARLHSLQVRQSHRCPEENVAPRKLTAQSSSCYAHAWIERASASSVHKACSCITPAKTASRLKLEKNRTEKHEYMHSRTIVYACQITHRKAIALTECVQSRTPMHSKQQPWTWYFQSIGSSCTRVVEHDSFKL